MSKMLNPVGVIDESVKAARESHQTKMELHRALLSKLPPGTKLRMLYAYPIPQTKLETPTPMLQEGDEVTKIRDTEGLRLLVKTEHVPEAIVPYAYLTHAVIETANKL